MSNDPQVDYGYEILYGIPSAMHPWEMSLKLPQSSEFGEYVLVSVEQSPIELHHTVEVIDESGDPLRGVWVIYGTPGHQGHINLSPRINYWRDAPAVLAGNAQRTSLAGYTQHTFGGGGEDIWIWNIDEEGDLKLPSPIIYNASSRGTPIGWSEHTGVSLVFQRRRVGVVPEGQRLDQLETRVAMLEGQLGVE
ncbi:MAG: hypothetical protein ACE5G8_06330 [Anaerolineae bacterium]